MQKEKAQWFALIDISNKKLEFFTKTLDTLRLAEYGEEKDKKKVDEVFLIESNMDTIPEDSIKRFGQNKKTKDGEYTSIYIKKKFFLEKLLTEFTIKSYLNSPDEFIKRYSLHNTNSLKRFINSIIRAQRDANSKFWKKIISYSIAILVPSFIILILVIKFKIFSEKLEEHLILTIIIVVLMLLVIFLEKFVSKKLEKL